MNLWHRLLNVLRIKPGDQRIYVSPRQAGVLVTEDTAMTLPEWWACVSIISRTVAALPWHVFQRTSGGREPVENSIAWLLNNQPNPEMTAFSFREALVAHALNWGNGYAEIQRDMSGRAVALWLITPDRVTPDRRESDGALIYKVMRDDGIEDVLEPANVYHLHGLGFDGLVGYSVVRMCARALGVGIAQETFSQAFYGNGTVMGAVIEVGAGMKADQIADAENYYNEKHRGPDKAFKVKVSPAGTKVHQLGMPMTDAQFVESRKLSVNTAARLLGIPPHKIGDLERSTNNNIEHQGIEFVTDAIVPWAMRLEQEANSKLFGMRSQGRVYTKLNVNSLMRGDAASRAAYYKTMVEICAMSINEVRELEEMNGIGPSGDARLVQLNQTTLDWLVKNPDAKSDAAASGAEPTPTKAPKPTNVIREEALQWAREQKRKQA